MHLTVPVGHKTGQTTGVTNDVGVIYSRSGPIVISFYNMNTGTRADTEDMMGEVARSVLENFDGARKNQVRLKEKRRRTNVRLRLPS